MNEIDCCPCCDIRYCEDCGHFHEGDCEYAANESCGSYMCCIEIN